MEEIESAIAHTFGIAGPTTVSALAGVQCMQVHCCPLPKHNLWIPTAAHSSF